MEWRTRLIDTIFPERARQPAKEKEVSFGHQRELISHD
jgi:hypothetical protein